MHHEDMPVSAEGTEVTTPSAEPQVVETRAEKTEVAEEFREKLAEILSPLFSDTEKFRQYLQDRYLAYEQGANRITEDEVAVYRDGYLADIAIEPRFGTQEDYLQRLTAEVSQLQTFEERMAMVEGLAGFRRSNRDLARVNNTVEGARKDPTQLLPTDSTLVVANLLRTIYDRSVMDMNVSGGIEFATRYEEFSGQRIFERLAADYQRLLNEADGQQLRKYEVVSALEKVGFKVNRKIVDEAWQYEVLPHQEVVAE